jgi:hypothetical protein
MYRPSRTFIVALAALTVVAGLSGSGIAYAARAATRSALAAAVATAQANALISSQIRYNVLLAALTDQGENKGTSVSAKLLIIRRQIQAGNYLGAQVAITAQEAALNASVNQKNTTIYQTELAREQAMAAAEAARGDVAGTVTGSGAPLGGATVALLAGTQVIANQITAPAGTFDFHQTAGQYVLNISLGGYVSVSQSVTVTARTTVTSNVSLNKVPPPPTPTPVPRPIPTPQTSFSTAYSRYYQTTIDGFAADVMSFDLGSGHIRVKVDTADDADCTNACSVLPVLDYVQRDSGFAGVNGTYFCPTAYSSCVGQTNSFYWKVYSSRQQRMVNATNGLGVNDPFFIFDSSGHATFLSEWAQWPSAGPLYAGISCKPALVIDGQYAEDESQLDSEELSDHVGRAALALKGQTLYWVMLSGATVPQLGHAMQSFGVEDAINLDAGGSTGVVYNGQYVLGPGRAVPNALVFQQY